MGTQRHAIRRASYVIQGRTHGGPTLRASWCTRKLGSEFPLGPTGPLAIRPLRRKSEEHPLGEHGLVDVWLERLDRGVYLLVAVLFLVAATAMGGYSILTFVQHIGDDFPLDLITFINDLLLVLIILEVLGTVRSYLQTGTTSLEPFLYIGTISATRRILAIGAQATLKGESDETVFRHLMIDLGVNGMVVLALALALFLLKAARQRTVTATEMANDL